MRFFSLLIILVLSYPTLAQSNEKPCDFDINKAEYIGTAIEQATCLLREVKLRGRVAQEKSLPKTIFSKVSIKKLDFNSKDLKRYLNKKSISDVNSLGGSVGKTLHVKTKYFIIHDTSTPNFLEKDFPNDLNSTTKKWNKLPKYKKKAHVFVNRLGDSLTKHNFSKNWRATKFENLKSNRKHIAVAIELVQPRRSNPLGKKGNDAFAPDPGFTEQQMERLALLYYTASLRANKYLIPAFHAVIDLGLNSPHDDPQNFNLDEWDKALEKVFNEIKSDNNSLNKPLFYQCGNSQNNPIYCEKTNDENFNGPFFYQCGSSPGDLIYCRV